MTDRHTMARVGRAMPAEDRLDTIAIENRMQAFENFRRVFDIRPGDRLVMLTDRKLDPRVTAAVSGLARAQGVDARVFMSHTTQHSTVPDEVKPLLETATFVVSTWFCSVIDPFCIGLRRDRGQRWVKITYFRDWDLLETPQARFPVDLVGEIIRATAARFPDGRDFDLGFTDPRGSDFTVGTRADMTAAMKATNRWRGEMTASEPGAYVHYLPTHGPNLYERPLATDDPDEVMAINGVIYPQWAVGFPEPFAEPIAVRFEDDRITEVEGDSEPAEILREMLPGARLIELGCGFNPKAPRHTIYPAGPNSPGALHFGVDLARPSNYIRRVMPEWEEPPVHMDLVSFDMTVTADTTPIITGGFLEALRDETVIAKAQAYGDPVDLLERWPD